jgi:hypothetical protein
MAAIPPFFLTANRRNIEGKKIPQLSHSLDSVRKYQWEVTFHLPVIDGTGGTESRPLTLACKNISEIGFDIEEIVADRVNDKFYYPGKATPKDVTFTFDNIFATKTSHHLYEWIKTIYDPTTGQFTPGLNERGAGSFKINTDVVELNNQGIPIAHTRLVGLWPKTWSEADRDYSASDFHTITLTCRYDFVVKYPNATI